MGAVLRIKAWTPGVYQFHCHEEQHVALGLMMALNILPSKQPPIPDNVPTEGPCPVWSANDTVAEKVNKDLVNENEKLARRVAMLEEKLQTQQDKCESAKKFLILECKILAMLFLLLFVPAGDP